MGLNIEKGINGKIKSQSVNPNLTLLNNNQKKQTIDDVKRKQSMINNENGNEYYNQTFLIKHSFRHRWHRVKKVGR